MIPGHNAEDLDILLNYIDTHSKTGGAIFLEVIEEEGFHNRISYDEIQDMVIKIAEYNDTIIKPYSEKYEPPYGVGRNYRLKEFLMMGGFRQIYQDHLESVIQEQKDSELDRRSKQATVTASDAAISSAQSAKLSIVVAVVAVVASFLFWYFPRQDEEAIKRIQSLEQQVQQLKSSKPVTK